MKTLKLFPALIVMACLGTACKKDAAKSSGTLLFIGTVMNPNE